MSSLFIYADGTSRLVDHRAEDAAQDRVFDLRSSVLGPDEDDIDGTIYAPTGEAVSGSSISFGGGSARQLVDVKGRPVYSDAALRMMGLHQMMLAGVVSHPVNL